MSVVDDAATKLLVNGPMSQERSLFRPVALALVTLASLGSLAACSVTPLGATQPNLTAATQKAAPGAAVYVRV